jgi:2,3-bisphosphoglycerate-independent phosphoglycerate mutase
MKHRENSGNEEGLPLEKPMNWEKIATELSTDTPSKIVLLVMDGLGGLPRNGKTALEAAHTPHLDNLAAKSACGLSDPVFMGITPGSGPAHLSLFGYDPLKHTLGRGILEALGVGVEVGKDDIVARGNFATHKDDMITDRRAGRIPTSENVLLCEKINAFLESREGPRIKVYPGKEHRFVVKFSGENLCDALSDADPQKENKLRAYTQPLDEEAQITAAMVNSFLDDLTEFLKDSIPANTVLLRGFSKHPSLPSMQDLFKIKPVALANYPMYKGLAKLVGMAIADVGPEIEDLFDTLDEIFLDYNFFYIHVKKTDAAGEDGNYDAKKAAIAEIDTHIPRLVDKNSEVLVITSDHSTPCLLKSHSWHPNPFMLHAQTAMPDAVVRFSERTCCQGYLGRFQAIYAMPLMLAHAGKLKKYGA